MDLAPMVLDWDEPTPEVKDAFRKFSPGGLATIVMDLHGKGGKMPQPHVWKGMPVLPLLNHACNFEGAAKTAKRMAYAIRSEGGKVPGFYFFRITWSSPAQIHETVAALRQERPDLAFEVLDPHSFFDLFERYDRQRRRSAAAKPGPVPSPNPAPIPSATPASNPTQPRP